MKKTYMQPELNVVKIEHVQLMSGSPTGTLDKNQTIGSSSDFGAHDDDFDW